MAIDSIDLNLDAGESPEALADGREASLYGLVTSVNIACGGHAGNAVTMEKAVARALEKNLNIGAHPSYPDLAGFGRTVLKLGFEPLVSSLCEQMESLIKICRNSGARLSHVKPHGALYNQAAFDRHTADAIIEAVRRTAPRAMIVGLAGSPFLGWCEAAGFESLAEGFPDRRYESDGTLRSREFADALITDPPEVGGQAVNLVTSPPGGRLDTLCIHGDSPTALQNVMAIRDFLAGARIQTRPFAPKFMAR